MTSRPISHKNTEYNYVVVEINENNERIQVKYAQS